MRAVQHDGPHHKQKDTPMVAEAPDKVTGSDAPVPLQAPRPTTLFPVDAFPHWLASMVDAVATATQTDPAMAGTSALSVLAATAGGRAEIEVRPGWREPLCLYTATIAYPGERKSAVQGDMTKPLLGVEQDLAEKGEAARVEALAARDVEALAAEHAKGAAGKEKDKEKREKALAAAVSAATAAEAIKVPAIPRILADDVTPEAAAGLLAEHRGALAIVSAEGGIFESIAGRYSTVPNLDVFLKGHAGDPIKVDRRGRAPEYIAKPALTIGLMIQPDVLRAIAENRVFRGRGLTARFLYAQPGSKVGSRSSVAPAVPADVRDKYAEQVSALARDLYERSGDPAPLVLTPEAHQVVIDLMDWVEPSLSPESGTPGDFREWGSKWVGAVTRIAGLLHLAEHGSDGLRYEVGEHTMRAAERVGHYFYDHARSVLSEMGTDQDTRDAVYLLDRIRTNGNESLTERDMMRLARAFKSRAALLPALTRLIDAGWLIPDPEQEHQGPGRKPSPTYAVHGDTWT